MGCRLTVAIKLEISTHTPTQYHRFQFTCKKLGVPVNSRNPVLKSQIAIFSPSSDLVTLILYLFTRTLENHICEQTLKIVLIPIGYPANSNAPVAYPKDASFSLPRLRYLIRTVSVSKWKCSKVHLLMYTFKSF